MGISFRKSIKIGKNTRINLSSKGGVGFSTGMKGARISVNKQGAKVYGGKGIVRYQKQLYSNNNSDKELNQCNESSYGGKTNFIKRWYKEIITVFAGILIGSFIGGIGKVDTSIVDKTNVEIQTNKKMVENKKDDLEKADAKKAELEAILNN